MLNLDEYIVGENGDNDIENDEIEVSTHDNSMQNDSADLGFNFDLNFMPLDTANLDLNIDMKFNL